MGAVGEIILKSKLKSFHASMRLLDSMILTVLLYAVPIWAHDQALILDRIQDTFLRRFLCLPSYTPGYILRAETGRNSLDITVKTLTLKFWTRVLKMDGSRLPSICLAHLWDISISSKQNIGLKPDKVSQPHGSRNIIRRIKRLGLNLEKLEREIEENAADCFEIDAILKKIVKIKQQFEQAYEYFIGIKDTDELLLQIEEVTDKYCKLEKVSRKHNILIHIDANIHQFKEHTVGIPAIEEPDKNQAESSVKENNDALGVTSIHNTTCLMSNQEDSFVLLSTATIMVMKHQGKYQSCRALINTASQAALITRDCLKKQNLEPSRTRVELAGIGGQILDRPNGVINLNFTSHFNMSRIFKTNALVVDKVTSYMPYLKFEEHQFDHLQGLQLADPQYQYTAPIDILLGADIAFSIFKGAIKYGHEGQPKAIKTLLGWLLLEKLKPFKRNPETIKNCTHSIVRSIIGNQYFPYGKKNPKPNLIHLKMISIEIHFKTTNERETSGRYIVRLPFKDPSLLGESKPQAINCFLRMEQILKQQPQVYQTYKDFMQEYLVLKLTKKIITINLLKKSKLWR
ncbi:hypothetical protein LAZ67_2005625 [Cordylochernes scorpioides]|uniref:Uncharacterized protein n=1 Tax=Cordylochernes scorpioides TaxID=51811 RepID=A0ABY6K4J5_9ARAC|nr:hypothetical protein LAZ67_2005625 [Cordylochernes scorpioides]